MGAVEQGVQIAHSIFGDFQKLLGEKIILKIGEKMTESKAIIQDQVSVTRGQERVVAF